MWLVLMLDGTNDAWISIDLGWPLDKSDGLFFEEQSQSNYKYPGTLCRLLDLDQLVPEEWIRPGCRELTGKLLFDRV